MSPRRYAFMTALLVVMIALFFGHPARANADAAVDSRPGVCQHQIGPAQAYGSASPAFSGPINEICMDAYSWILPAKGMAQNLLIALLVVEFFFVGVQTGLFKNDLSELLSTVTFKVFVSCLMIYVIQNADTILYGVVEGFEYAGRDLTGVEGKEGSEIATVVNFFLTTGIMFANKAGALQTADLAMAGSQLSSSSGGALFATTVEQHNQHAAILGFLGLVLLFSAGTILLQYFLITAESFIVIFGGIVFLGFAGSRFTMPFAQGYLSYAMNNGARFFAFYLVMTIEFKLVGMLTLSAALPLDQLDLPGVSVFPLLGVSAAYVMQAALMASLCWFIPNIAGSLMTGGSAFSAQSMMGNLSGMVAGVQSMVANNQAAKATAADQQRIEANAAALKSAHSAPHAVHAADDSTMAPAQSGPLGESSLSPSAGGAEHPSSGTGVTIPHQASPGSANAASAPRGGSASNGAAALGASHSAPALSAGSALGSGNRGTEAASAPVVPTTVGFKAHAIGSSPSGDTAASGGLAQGQSLGGSGGGTGGPGPSAADENAAAQAGTSLTGLSKSQMGAVSGSEAANAATAGNLAGTQNLSSLTPAATSSAQQAITEQERNDAVLEAFDRSQEATGIRSAVPTGETPPPAVQVRLSLGEQS